MAYNTLQINALLKKYKEAKKDEKMTAALAAMSGQEPKDVAFSVFNDEERAAVAEEAAKKLAKTTINLMVNGHEFYANILLKLKKNPVWGMDNLCHRFHNTDVLLDFDPIFVLDNTVNTLKYHLVHEVFHLVLRHEQRLSEKKDTKVDLGTEQTDDKNEIERLEATDEVYRSKDVAADFAVNQVMPHEFKAKVPKASLTEALDYGVNPVDPTLDKYDDDVLNKFMHVKDPDNEDNNNNNGGGGGGGSGSGKKRINQHPQPHYEDALQEVLSSAQVDNMILDAVKNSSNGIGDLPGCILDEIEKLNKPPQVDWKAALRNFVAAKIPAQSTRTWARLNRRFPYIIKGNKKRRVPLITVAIDTSGSVDDDQLATFLPEIDAIRKIHKADVEFIQCDSQIQDISVVKPKEKFPATFKGRGGTSFLPVWDYLDNESKRKPDVVIYLSDLEVYEGDFPNKAKPYGIMYVGTNKSMVEEWSKKIRLGRFVYLKVDQKVAAQ